MGAKLLKMLKTDMPPLTYRHLGPIKTLYVDLYTNASYRNVDDGVKSSDGMVIVLRGYNGNASLLGWRSKGTTRVCCSARTAELCALDSGLDSALLIKLYI